MAAATDLGLSVEEEKDKRYPRDAMMQLGRIRVCVKNNGEPANAEVPSKKKVLLAIGDILVRKHQAKVAQEAQSARPKAGGKPKGKAAPKGRRH